jgi:hypothetical protein
MTLPISVLMDEGGRENMKSEESFDSSFEEVSTMFL